MLSRRHLRYWVSVTGVLLAATIALAGKPSPTPIIATTTDENFLNNVRNHVSSQTLFNLVIDVSGTGTHYRYQIGQAALIDPSDSAAYSSVVPEATPLIADISGYPDGDFVLCLQALQIDKRGKTQYVQNPPTVYSWVKAANTEPPQPPQGTATLVPLAGLVGDVSQFKVAMDGTGNAMAIAPNIDAAGWHYWNCSAFDGSTWNAATRIADALPDELGGSQLLGGGANCSYIPILQSDGAGKYLFTWIEYDNSGQPWYPDVRAAFYDGTAWGSVQLINEESDVIHPYALTPQAVSSATFNYGAAYSANGDAMIAWVYAGQAPMDNNNYIVTRLYTDGDWQPEEIHVSTEPRLPAIAADDVGNFMLAFVHGNTDGPTEGYVYYKLYDENGWSDEARLNLHPNMVKAMTSVGNDNVVKLCGTGYKQFAAVYQSQAVNLDIDGAYADNVNLYGRYFNGIGWGNEYALDNQDGAIFPELRLAMSADASAIAMWTQHDGTSLKVYASRCDGAGSWDTEPTVLSCNTFGDAKTIYGGIAMDAAGNALATFYDKPYPQYTVVKAHYLSGYGWELTDPYDTRDWPFDRESLTVDPPASLAESQVAGQADGKAIILHTPDDPDCVFPVDHFISMPLDIGPW